MTTMDGSTITLSTWLGQHNMLTTLIGIVGMLIYIFVSLLEKSVNYKSLRLPPGPQGWPVVGNLLQLGKLPHQTLADLSEQYGSLMFLHMGSVPTLVVSSAEMAEEVFSTQDHLFPSEPPINSSGITHYRSARRFILAPLGDQWRFMRRVSVSSLFSEKRLEQFQWLACKAAVVYESALHYTESPLRSLYGGFQGVRREEILSMVKRTLREGHDGNVVRLSQKIYELAYNHTTQMLFRKSYFGLKSTKSEVAKEAEAFQKMVGRLSGVGILGPIGDFLPFFRKIDFGAVQWKLWYFFRVYDKFLSAIVKDHRQKPFTAGTRDFVDLLLSLRNEMIRHHRTDENIKALIKDLMTGGTETFSTQVVWTLAELMRHSEIRRRVQEELDTVVGKERFVEESDLVHLKYLHAVVKESFRLHPVLPLGAPHESTMATKIGGYELPSETKIFFNLYAIQRDPKVWENPLVFNPDRFMVRKNSATTVGEDFELLPLSPGRRLCVGLNLDLTLVKYTLAQLLHTCELSLPLGFNSEDVDMEERFGSTGTMSKAQPLEVLVSPRLPPRVYKGL